MGGIEVIGPVSLDTQWQARTPSGIDTSQFVLDWEHHQATCPLGKTSSSWTAISRKYQRRTLMVRPQAQHTALQAAWQQQRTKTFQQRYALRAGIEATIS